MGQVKYIFSEGELFQKDFSVVFKKDSSNFYLPIANLKEIYSFNDITFSSKLLQLFSKYNIIVHFYGYYGNYVGTFYPKEHLLSGRLLIAQVDAYKEKRMVIAKKIVKAIAANIYHTLYHYFRHGKTEIHETLKWLRKDAGNLIKKSNNINNLLYVEGLIWQKFYNTFNVFLRENFQFINRVRRPPDNPINALISFGNSLLYTRTIAQLSATHLNSTISYLHQPSERRFSLSLDISEAFKPIIVFKTIFDCINNKKLCSKKHFRKELNSSLLTEEGMKIFVTAFDERMKQTFLHSKLKRRVSYNQAIKLDGYKLIKYLLEDTDFEFFSIENCQ